MIELWQVALALAAVSLGAWFEVERTFGKKARVMKERLLAETRNKIIEIYEKERDNISEESIKEIGSLYEKSGSPISFLDETLRTFLISGVLFLGSVASRLAIDYLEMKEVAAIEGISFLIGFVIFAVAIYNSHILRNLVFSEKDPPVIPLLGAVVVGIMEGINAYLLLIFIPIVLSGRATIDLIVFVGFLLLSFPGAVIYLWGLQTESESARTWSLAGFSIMSSPWIYLIVIAVFAMFLS